MKIHNDYTEEQKQYILENQQNTKNKEMAIHLGVSNTKIQKWIAELGIDKQTHFNKNKMADDGFFHQDKTITTI